MNATASSSLLPTLTVCGNYNVAGLSPNSGDGLVTALKRRGLLPTLMRCLGNAVIPAQAIEAWRQLFPLVSAWLN